MENLKKILYLLLLGLCATPLVSAPWALLMGIMYAWFIGSPFSFYIKKYRITTRVLQIAVVGLGFGMYLDKAILAGKQGVIFTVLSITGTLLLGLWLGKILKIDRKLSWLTSTGTAICGGSAIAAVSPVIQAEEKQISVALAIVFILNSIALLIFPPIGHWLGLSQIQFGMWSAIAIHDTSSVVGAASVYGSEALEVATTVKLTRALWIIPLTLLTAMFFREGKQKTKFPYFILLFVLAMVIHTYIPSLASMSNILASIARTLMVMCLFLIGSGLSLAAIRSVGMKPLVQGIVLWFAISVISLWVIMNTIS